MAAPFGRELEWGAHVGIVGLQQTGKSTLARRLCAGARRVLVYDPKGDHARHHEGRRGTLVLRPEELEDVDGSAPLLRVVVLGARDPDVEPSQEVKYLIRKAREWGDGGRRSGIVLLLDELHLYSAQAAPALRSLLASGHGISPAHGGIVSVLVSQRGVDLPLGCRALLTRCYSFRQSHPADLARLSDEFGGAFAERARTWKAGEEPATWEQERFYR